MVSATPLAFWIPVLPLAAFAVNILFGRKVGKNAAWLSVGTSALAMLLSWPIVFGVVQGTIYKASFAWLPLGERALQFGYLIDPVSATLLFMVTLVGTLIQIYSVGYMHGDPRFSRFFAYVSLFMAAMLTLVIADNYILFFMSWEVMGLCSYLLIGFWFEKPSAANASKKAFLTTRIGDIGLLLGIMTLFVAMGTFNFTELEEMAHHGTLPALLPVAVGLIFCGTIGKSAQFPLHVWLPDAMEGPTPVSSLIHAATMVAAGVYLLVRSFVLLEHAPEVMSLVAGIGTFTAFMAACIALTATDIKKVLAYSTISQLGYMVAALGLGSMNAGFFHLVTHAFFKALLFMGAGSVIHGTGTQDIRDLGGLFSKMKSTAWTFLIASLAIAGVPPLSGFWSKDEILGAAAHDPHHAVIYVVLLVTAFMTAFYMFRLFFLTFMGKPRDLNVHAHESPASMTLPLWILAAGAALIGIPGSPLMNFWFQGFLAGGHGHAAHEPNMAVMITSVIVGLAGIGTAAFLYLVSPALPEKIARAFKPLTIAFQNKFWVDEFYAAVFVRPFHAIGQALFRVDAMVIDGTVNNTGVAARMLASAQQFIDKYVVDGIVNFTAHITEFFSAIFRRIQTGLIQNYLLFVFVGVVVLLYFGIR